jgi:uncharacterized protein (DUF2141 family)
MMRKSYLCAAGLLAAGLLGAATAQAQNISLVVTGIKSSKGQLIVSVFKNNESFRKEQPAKAVMFSKAAVVNGMMKVSLSLEPGTYGLALVDDEDSNAKMKKGMLGIPKEGFGFSNFYLSGMSRPSFNDFKFDVKNTPVKLESKMRYM